jgi:hypothetical protein
MSIEPLRQALLCRELISVVLCLVGANPINSANARQTTVTKAEAALTAEIVLVEKPGNGGVTIKEILPVRFSQLEDAA